MNSIFGLISDVVCKKNYKFDLNKWKFTIFAFNQEDHVL